MGSCWNPAAIAEFSSRKCGALLPTPGTYSVAQAESRVTARFLVG